MAMKKTYSLSETSKKLGISRPSVLLALKEGKLKGKKVIPPTVKKVWAIDAESVDGYKVSVSHQERGKNV